MFHLLVAGHSEVKSLMMTGVALLLYFERNSLELKDVCLST